MKKFTFLGFALLSATLMQAQTTAYQFRSTDGNFWKMSTVNLSDKVPGKAQVVIRTSQPKQTFLGWGTCFNELPWDAYNLLSDTDKQLLVKRMFNPNGDLRLQKGRLSAGANDYARDWYSCDEIDVNSTDFEMEHFNIDRDLTTIIPSIKLALAENPEMDFFVSPWSPPTWMKTNKHYAQRPTNTNGCPFGVPPYFNDQFIDDPQYYKAYCLYFDKFINAYKEQGINITSLAYQNEAYSNTPYPGCSWTAKTTGKFLAEYLGPYMREHQPNLKLIIGTMNTGSLDVYEQILSTPNIDKYMDAIGFQWEGGNQINEVLTRHPQYEAIQTENECGSGTFDWNAGAHTFQLANHYLANKVTTYYYWNAVLKDNGISPWGWIQNAMIQVNSATKTARYTPEYYAYSHYTHFIPAGSKILTTDESRLVTTALSPDGNIIIVAGNNGNEEKTVTFDVDGKYMVATLPAKSFSSYVVGQSDKSRLEFLRKEAQGLVDIERASLTVEQTEKLDAALRVAGETITDSAAVINSLADAVLDVRKDVGSQELSSEIQNASFTDGSSHWVVANKSNGGDFRTNTIAGKTCWNNWSNNFTSMDIHQDLGGLTPGAYTLSAVSMCGPGEISDQHAYLSAQGDVAVSPVKEVAIWNTTAGWETQTTAPVVVGTDGTLRIGYASTSGGGTKGWFCVSDFALTRVEDDATLVKEALDAAVVRAEAKDDASLKTLIDEAKAAEGRENQLEALTHLRAAMATTTTIDLTENIAAYKKVSEEAHQVATDEQYAEEARQKLLKVVNQYDTWIADEQELSAPAIDDVIRSLNEAINKTRLAQKPGDDTDFTYCIQNPGAESTDGWQLSVTNGDGTRKGGGHYSNDGSNMYFDSYNGTAGNLWFTGHQTLTDLPNGTYTLKACGRSDGTGVYLTAQTTDEWYQTEVTKAGNTGGELGNGWSNCEIQNIIVKDHTLTIGFTNDYYLTGSKFTGTWMSMDDFKLYYVSESTLTSVNQVKSDEAALLVKGGKGCIMVTTDEPVKVYSANGMLMGRTDNLPAGIYVVRTNYASAKVMVY